MQAQETNKKKNHENNNNTTPQPKWYGHTLDLNKAITQAQQIMKDKKNNTNNK